MNYNFKRICFTYFCLLCLLLQAQSLCAASVNLPSSVGEDRHEKKSTEVFTFKETWMNNWLEDVRGSIGAEIDYLYGRDMDVVTVIGAKNSKIEGQFYSVKMGFSLNEKIDIYTNIGVTEGIKYTFSYPSGRTRAISFENALTYGGGVTLRLVKFPSGLQWFVDGNFRAIDSLVAADVSDNGLTRIFSNAVEVESFYEEWHGAVGMSREFQIGVSENSPYLLMYAGAKYSNVSMLATGNATAPGAYGTGHLKAKDNVGFFTGLSYICGIEEDTRYTDVKMYSTIDLQARFCDETAFSLNFNFKF
ncbi:MAG: hypothetical protein GY853_03545 [PVC group bacterium]|nr:hypothetical protein [PVC group bacterium]